MRRRTSVAAVLAVAGLLGGAACGGESTSGARPTGGTGGAVAGGTGGTLSGGTGGSTGCAQGETRACVGPGACPGGQLCVADGTWGVCDCGAATGGSAGSTVEEQPDPRFAVTCDPDAVDSAGRYPWALYPDADGASGCDCPAAAVTEVTVSMQCLCSFEACPSFETAVAAYPTCLGTGGARVRRGCGRITLIRGWSGEDGLVYYAYDAQTYELVGAGVATDTTLPPCITGTYHAGVDIDCPEAEEVPLCSLRQCLP
jgi:hypothetical protein